MLKMLNEKEIKKGIYIYKVSLSTGHFSSPVILWDVSTHTHQLHLQNFHLRRLLLCTIHGERLFLAEVPDWLLQRRLAQPYGPHTLMQIASAALILASLGMVG